MTIYTFVSVQCDNCTFVLCTDADDWGYDVTYFDDERDALLAARSARWYVDARKTLCPACWAQAIQAMQEEE